MKTIYLFRGMSATGKTLITDRLSRIIQVPVLRKDDIYDELHHLSLEHSFNSQACYNILAKIIQTNVDLGSSLIIDIALPHQPFIKHFLSKIDFKDVKLHQFLCICSDRGVWESRINARAKAPAPNQIFQNAQDAKNHYAGFDISPLKNEFVLDSAKDIDAVMVEIMQMIGV